jgi:hypothetical protein
MLAVAALSCGLLGASSGTASANFLTQYSVGLGGHTWQSDTCGGIPNCHRMAGAAANYQGAGTVAVCERVWDITAGQLASQRCANGYADALSDLAGRGANCLQLRVKNDSAFTHTIVGLINTIASGC